MSNTTLMIAIYFPCAFAMYIKITKVKKSGITGVKTNMKTMAKSA